MEITTFNLEKRITALDGKSMSQSFQTIPNEDCVEQIRIMGRSENDFEKKESKTFTIAIDGENMNIVYRIQDDKYNNKYRSEISIPICDAEKMCHNILQMICDLSFNPKRISLKKKRDDKQDKSEKHIAKLKASGLEIKIKENTSYYFGTKVKEGGMNIVETGERKGDKIFISVYTRTHGEMAGMDYKNIYELQESFNKEGYEEA